MSRYVLSALVMTIGLSLVGTTAAQELNATNLRRREIAQERAQAMARDLVTSILDIQLRQFEENGLAAMPVYVEIKTMRDNVDGLVGSEMQAVVELLVQAQEGDQASRLKHFNEARDQIREVVLALMAERQRLYRRLQIAKLAAQVRELIVIEERTRDRTVGLLDQPVQQRESVALTVIQDQRDVAGLFVQLVHDLSEVTEWGGKVGAGAADGIRILKAAQTGVHLDQADQNLATGQYTEAGQEQAEVIKGLKRLLEKLEETRGLISSDRDAARKLIEEITKKQEELRETTKETDLSQLTPDALTEKQEEIRNELGKLAQQLEDFEPLQPLLEQSKAAAHDAVAELFEGDQAEALADQSEVLGALAELAHQLDSAAPKDDAEKSADELAEDVKKLEELQNKLAETAKDQAAAAETAIKDPAAAQQEEASVAEELAHLADEASPAPVESRLLDAQEAAAEAAEALKTAQEQNASPEAMQSAQEAMEQATEAIEKAQAETAAQLADLKRKQLAVEVGELARAAEALERAAAAERDIAADAMEAAAMPAEEAKEAAADLAETQQQVDKVAKDVAAGLENTAPQVAEMLKNSEPQIAEAAKDLASAAQQQNAESAAKDLNEAAEGAKSASESLKQAAAQLRKEAGQAAQELAEMTGQQLAQTSAAKEAVKQSLDNAPSGDNLEQLQAAQEKIAEAQMEQMKAEGKTAAAEAQQLAQEIGKIAEMQQQANAAAAELNQGKANSPVDAAAKQQQVSDQAEMLAQEADGGIAEALQNAEKAAATAAKETLSGDPNKAAAAREEAAAQLASAQRKAEQMAAEKGNEPAGQPDAAAQAKAAELAAEAAQMAADAAPEASAAAQHAADAAEAAAENLASGEADGAAQNQAEADKSLGDAAQKLASAIDQAAQQMAQELGKQAPQLDQLAQDAGMVDPNAASALRQAEQASQQGAEMNSPQADGSPATPAPGEMQQAAESAQRSLQQAAAALTAREQQLARDKSIAEALAALAEQQQAARDAIDSSAQALADNMPSPPMGDAAEGQAQPPISPEAAAAAQQLANASRQFAEAQTATGQGAQQISGQQEVANMPLREGLEAASQLPLPEQSLAPAPPASDLAMGESGGEMNSSSQTPGGEGNQPSSNNQQLGQPAQGQGPEQQMADASASQSMPGMGQDLGQTSNELGTGLVPNSPQATADAIAGGEAVQQALAAMPAPPQEGAMPGQTAGAPKPGVGDGPTAQAPSPSAANAPTPGQKPQPGATSSVAAAGGTSQGGEQTQNQDGAEMPLSLSPEPEGGESQASLADGDSDAKARRFDNEPWFAKLPPGLQKAIQAGARREPPRGYEQRLRRYFENVD
ncbi:hypothetical protein LOC68_04820 [Blastopirellula sp. JC732]|uniref:Methyl-accepting transducer domain-containing protein n=1 Tax=Blastopirellula sediminis TaxID=2894196 RepID=A0A9X1MJY9_9BACT|nr:hypothetical protein [Blastopirellula sediminis]MCC9609517.1 hypothetical protein [Blastopirellula sediminis]MCC9627707.1 hypothetical protein [Blastopirellula sediminis]